MRPKRLYVKDIRYSVPKPTEKHVYCNTFVAWADVAIDSKDLVFNSALQLVEDVRKYLIDKQHFAKEGIKILSFTLVNAHKFIKGCPKNITCQWTYAGD